MSEADRLNETLRASAPAAFRCLSPLGLRAAFPHGIPFQAAQARGARIDATIGQLTDGAGHPLPLPVMSSAVLGLDPAAVFLYAPVDGPLALREAWRAREHRLGNPQIHTSNRASNTASIPVVTHGLTHALSLVASLFADADTDVLVPAPAWENYDLIFQLHAGARIIRYPVFNDGSFSVEGLEKALAQVRTKGLLILNFPSNPLGYMPTTAEVDQLVSVVTAHKGPLTIVTDDAYQGFQYEPDCHPRSVFWDLAEKADPERHFVIKCDAATKELVFFSSRVGFLAHTAHGAAADALTSKLKFLIRGTVGCASGPALALVSAALADPGLDAAIAERREIMAARYRTVRDGLVVVDSLPGVVVNPFNAAFFVFINLPDRLEAETVRRRLLDESSVGAIAFANHNALRLAYCSIQESALPSLVDAVQRVLK